MEKRAVKPVPDFKKLHQQWDERMKCTRQAKPNTVTKEFSLSASRRKQANSDCVSTPIKKEPTSTAKIPRSRPPTTRSNPRSSKRRVLDGLQKENHSPQKKVQPAQLQKQQGIEFKEDKQALKRILSTANENSDAGHRQTFAFGCKTPQTFAEPERMSIYCSIRPRPLGELEKAATKALTASARRATTLGMKAERTVNKTPAPPVPSNVISRNSIYMRCDASAQSATKQSRMGTPKQPGMGTPAKVLRAKTPTKMTAQRIPNTSKPPVSAASSTATSAKWADVLSPSKVVPDPLKRALFTDELSTPQPTREEPKTSNQSTPNTSLDAVSPRLSLSDEDLKKFQEIEEREKKLLAEINEMTQKQEKKTGKSHDLVASKQSIDQCAASVQKAADNFNLYNNSSPRNLSVTSGFSLEPSPDRESDHGAKKGGDQVGQSPLSDVDSAVDVSSLHNLTIDEINHSLNQSQMHFERLQSEFRTLQSGHLGDGDIMMKLQQIEKQQRVVLRQQQDLRQQLSEQQKQLHEQQRLMKEQRHPPSSPPPSAQSEAATPCTITAGATRRFSTSENSPFALFNRCQSIQKELKSDRGVVMPTSVKLSPAVTLPENLNIPLRTPLAMVESSHSHDSQTTKQSSMRCAAEVKSTPLQSVQSAFKRTRLTGDDADHSFELGPGLLTMTPYTAATRKTRTQLLAKTILSATSLKFHNALLDEEVGLYMVGGCKTEVEKRFETVCRPLNPLARTLMEGDDMHFIPIKDNIKSQSYTPEGSAFSTFIR